MFFLILHWKILNRILQRSPATFVIIPEPEEVLAALDRAKTP
jgi:hypothetical protein